MQNASELRYTLFRAAEVCEAACIASVSGRLYQLAWRPIVLPRILMPIGAFEFG